MEEWNIAPHIINLSTR